uniref:Uncharacterized protein n=1 Tax=Heliothis virescens TaxID=7102 RepID=A0A2A4JJ88_HELVI
MRGLLEFVMKDLISNQLLITETFDNIDKAIETDLASLSQEREDYAQKSINALKQLWSIFEDNELLLREAQTKDDNYFTDNIFNKVKDEYGTILPVLHEYMENAAAEPSSAAGETENVLISQQRSYFKALENEIRGIYIDRVQVQEEMEDWQRTLKARWQTIDGCHKLIREEFANRWPDVAYELEYVQYKNMCETTISLFNYKIDALLNPVVRVIPHIGIPTWRMFDNHAEVHPFAVNSVAWINFDTLSAVIRNNKISEGEKRQLLIRTFLSYQIYDPLAVDESFWEREAGDRHDGNADWGKSISPGIYHVD